VVVARKRSVCVEESEDAIFNQSSTIKYFHFAQLLFVLSLPVTKLINKSRLS